MISIRFVTANHCKCERPFMLIVLPQQQQSRSWTRSSPQHWEIFGNLFQLPSELQLCRYKICNILVFGCKCQCLCETMFINDITTLQAAMKAVYTIFALIFIYQVCECDQSALQVMSGQLCQTQTSVCSMFVSTDLIVTGTVLLSS